VSPQAGRQFHPIVQAHFDGRPLGEILAAYRDSREQPLPALVALMEALNGQRPAEEALAMAREVRDCGSPDLAQIFWSAWAELASRAELLDEMGAVVNRMRGAVGESDPPELRVQVLIYEGFHASRLGDKRRRCELLERAAALVPDGPQSARLTEVRGWFLAQLGMGSDVDADLDRIAAAGGQPSVRIVAGCRFTQCVETVQIREALRHLEILESGVEEPPSQRWRYWSYHNLLSVMVDRWIPRGRYGPTPVLPLKPGWENPDDDWTPVIDRLAARRPGEALERARQLAARHPDHHLQGIGFDTFNLIRCELACGSGEAARRIVVQRRALGNRHYLDDLYLARVELLAGNREAAVRHFATLSRAIRRYRAEGRLELELRLACELSPGDVLLLQGSGGQTPAAPAAEVPVAPAGSGQAARGLDRLVGRSPAVTAVRESVARIAPLDVPVLVTGETGTGKELVARAVHELSPRCGAPFLAINCGAIAETLLESELFGHERGAFTGASRARRGIFEEAAGGTVLLDEIGDVSPRLQTALLRVLEAGEIRPVGASRPRKVACRVLAATNADLGRRVREGIFREDLLFRLRRLEIAIPPLRERREDILPLAGHFLAENRRDGRRPAMSEELKSELERRPWPGNVRELRNAMERMRLMNSDKLAYELADLDGESGAGAQAEPGGAAATGPAPASSAAAVTGAGTLREGSSAMRRTERLRELFRTHRRLTRMEVAATLGISLPTATRDLQALCSEGFVEKVCPSRSPRSHYFRLPAT